MGEIDYNKIEMDGNEDIQRDELEINGRNIRVYNLDNSYIPSMSTLKKFKQSDDNPYEWWQNKNNGYNGSPHYKDLMKLLSVRGTIIHAETLSNFVKGDIYGEEEERADYIIDNYEEHREENMDVVTDWIPENVPYFNKNESPRDWVDRTVPKIENEMMNMLSDVRKVIAVEKYVCSKELGMAGQVDIVAKTKNDKILAIDLKSTSSIKESHKKQVRGYGEILKQEYDIPVDNYRIVRANTRNSNKNEECDSQILQKGMSINHGRDVSWNDDVFDDLCNMANLANAFIYVNEEQVESKFNTKS